MAATAAARATDQPGSSGAGSARGRPVRTVSTTNRQAPACPSERTSGTFARQDPKRSEIGHGALRVGRPGQAGVTGIASVRP